MLGVYTQELDKDGHSIAYRGKQFSFEKKAWTILFHYFIAIFSFFTITDRAIYSIAYIFETLLIEGQIVNFERTYCKPHVNLSDLQGKIELAGGPFDIQKLLSK
jgi:hypothetical protein